MTIAIFEWCWSMPVCIKCGSNIIQDASFCGNCGAQVTVPSRQAQNASSPQNIQPQIYSPQPANPAVGPAPYVQPGTAYGETIVGVFPLRKMKSLGRFDSYVGAVTNYRLIIAQLTKQMINDSVNVARKEAKAQGKGYMGQISSQMREFSTGYTTRFLGMTPQAILSETPGNYELNNGSIADIRVRLNGSSQDEDSVNEEFDVEIFSGGSKYDFRTDGREDYMRILWSAYGERVRRR